MARLMRRVKKVKTRVQKISLPKLKTPRVPNKDLKYKSIFSKAAGGRIK